MKISALIKLASAAATVGFADAKFTRGSLSKTEEGAKRHIDSTELSMPGQMKDSPGDNAGIAELLAENGVDENGISGFLMALDMSTTKMSSGPARVVCTTIVDEILDFFLFGREVEEGIKVIVCGEDEELTITSLNPSQSPSDVPSAGPTITDVPSAGPTITCGGDIKKGETCQLDSDCGCGLWCDPWGSQCVDCVCPALLICSSNSECGNDLCTGGGIIECPNLRE